MTELEKPKAKPRAKKKPPTQTAGVNGIDAHGGMGEAPIEQPSQQYIDWQKLIGLPAFEMFVFEESGQQAGASASEWVSQRRSTMGDEKLYDLYAKWHKAKGLWVGESPMGVLIQEVK